MATDPKTVRKIQDWLNSPEKNISEGAELLLAINRNRMMYQYILRKRDEGKLTYELRKYLKIFLDGMSRRDVVVMEHQVMPRAKATLSAPETRTVKVGTSADIVYKGKRPDHDQLPEAIRKIYERNGDVFFRMKRVYNTLLQMEDAEPCDRYEQLKMLDELDREYRANWGLYDSYTPGDGGQDSKAVTPKKVNAARKYLSDNKKKLATLKDEAKKAALLNKMQERIDLLVDAGETFEEKYQRELEKLGLHFSS